MRTFVIPLEPGDDSPWWKNAWKRIDPVVAAEWASVVLIALFYAAFKTYSMWVHDGDEHIYFAMAQAVVRGKMPYWDFFFAHPPVHLLVPALLFAVFGFSYNLALWIAPLASLAAGLAVWRLVRRFGPGWVGVLAMLLFLFGRTVVQSSSHLTGVNIGLMFLCWGAERLAADKPKTGGVLLALSVLTGLYFLPASVGVLALYAFYRPRRSLGALAAFLLLGLGVAVIFQIATRGQFLEQVFFFQRAKDPSGKMAWTPSFDSLKGGELVQNWTAFLGSIIGGLASFVALLVVADRGRGRGAGADAGRRKVRTSAAKVSAGDGGTLAAALRTEEVPADETPHLPPRGPLAGVRAWLGSTRRSLLATSRQAPWAALGLAGALWVACHWILLATLPVVWRYYFAVVFVGASVTTAAMVFAAWRGLRPIVKLVRDRRRGMAWSPVAFAGAIVLSFALGFGHDLALGKKYDIWNLEDEAGKEPNCEADSCRQQQTDRGCAGGECSKHGRCECVYAWQDSPTPWVPGWFNSLVRALFWGGPRMPDGGRTWSLENTLWHESRNAPMERRYLEAARTIYSRACDGDTIFGDSGTAPMLANMTGLRIAGDVFDTNQQRFDTGYIDAEDTVQRITADGLRFVVLGGNRWAREQQPIADLLEKEFQPLWPAPGDSPAGITVYVTKAPGWCE
ncbi:MAG: hypothetical protein HY905_14525 [Deltaproteobacteria bacterium]|nr:hypothetical protein [Deltaproteobacteria bacterium]